MSKIKASKLKVVVSLQLIGWGIYFIITTFFHSFFVHGMHDEILYAKLAFTFSLLGFIFSFYLYFAYEFIGERTKNPFVLIPLVLVLSYFLTNLWMGIYKLASIFLWNHNIKILSWDNLTHYSFDKTFVFIIWSAIYFIIDYWNELKLEREKSLKADAALNEAKYNVLKYQVNPHFLFNALNSIVGMIDEDKTKAKNMVEGLSEFFRYSLNKGNQSVITLNEELEGIKNYLEIEKDRFEDNLIIEYNISHEAGRQNIPGFIVHPLVENALKYGMKTSTMPLNVSISASIDHNSLFISVTNSGTLITAPAANGDTIQSSSIGIKNITERLKLAYGDKYNFKLSENDGFVKAQIAINDITTSE